MEETIAETFNGDFFLSLLHLLSLVVIQGERYCTRLCFQDVIRKVHRFKLLCIFRKEEKQAISVTIMEITGLWRQIMFTSIPEKRWSLHKNVSILKNGTKILDDCRQHQKSEIFQPLHCNVISWGPKQQTAFHSKMKLVFINREARQ